MAHYYFLRPHLEDVPEESAPVVLQVYTDEDGLIQRLGPPAYREADAAMQQLVDEWREYVAGADTQDINLLHDFLLETYGAAYQVVQRY